MMVTSAVGCVMCLCLVTGIAAQHVYPPATYPATSYGKSNSERRKFVPADEGEAPSCLTNPRLTYCTDPDDYPK